MTGIGTVDPPETASTEVEAQPSASEEAAQGGAIRRAWDSIVSEPADPAKGQAALWGIGIATLCAMTTGQSFLRFGDSAPIASLGLLAGLFVLLLYAAYAVQGWVRAPFLLGSILAMLASGGLLVWHLPTMIARSDANDRRCELLQEQMLSAHPLKVSAPEVFKALGCQPTGTDTRIMIP